MGAGPITFSYPAWIARYPEFVGVSQPLAQQYFAEATLYCDNTGAGPVRDPIQLALLLNMLTAHVAAINAPQIAGAANDGVGSGPNSTLVGRIDSATEGSVTVSADMPEQPGTEAWFNQTKYGAAYVAATLQYRTMRYYVGPRRRFGPLYGGFGRF